MNEQQPSPFDIRVAQMRHEILIRQVGEMSQHSSQIVAEREAFRELSQQQAKRIEELEAQIAEKQG